MDISFVPSLQHMCCVKIVTSLFNGLDTLRNDHPNLTELYEAKPKLTEVIPKLIQSAILQKKLESFIMPLLDEIGKWLVSSAERKIGCSQNSSLMLCKVPLPWSTIQQCWRLDGTLDREKLMKVLIRNANVTPLNRFQMSSPFCIFEDIVHIWNDLYKTEKAYLRHKCSINPHMDHVMRYWIEWLQSSNTNNDWESFVKSALETPVWKSNPYMLKRVLQTLSPTEKGEYLVRALTGNETCIDVMRFGLPMMTPDEREVIFRESTHAVFRCILYWPLRCVFSDITEKLWPYITEVIFCDFLWIILERIKDEEKEFVELLEIVKSFWAQSPAPYKEFAQNNNRLWRPLNFVFEYDFSQEFSRKAFWREYYH